MMIKEIPISERPREKLIKYGRENLTDAELLAIVLKTGTKNCSVNDLAVNVIKEFGGIENLKNVSLNRLVRIKGIGTAKATELLVLSELAKRMNRKSIVNKTIYNNPSIIYEHNKDIFEDLRQEYFYCLYLNSKKELIERKLLFMGTLNKSVVHPREIFKEAYRLSASSIVCLHNHPSGDLSPSIEDIELTRSLIKIGKINGIPIVDHLIITDEGYYSFYENGER
ncbi:MAG: DNA repair protein RadC [Bacilli bacterium]|nr:DNA repair protein RadC [Bacilli bacterium]